MRISAILLLAPAVATLSAAAVHAQSAPPAIPESAYAAMRWRLVGPHRGGRVLAVSGVPGDPTTFYFGAVAGGVWRSGNAGLTWEPLFDGQPTAAVGALAVAPSDRKVIYVGTGEVDMRSDLTHGNGVYKSADGGKTWAHIGLADTRHVGKILVDPRDPNVALVAALGHAYGANSERGVFRTGDGGATWRKVLYKDERTGAIDLAADPTDLRVVYASLWRAWRTPWSQYPPVEGPGSGIYKSIDGGKSWTELTASRRGLPAGPLGRIGLAVARGSGGRLVYALVTSSARDSAGLYRSDDAGATWRLTSTDPRIIARGWYFGQAFVDPANPEVVYVPNVSFLRSTDGGRSFTSIKGSPGGDDYHDLWVDPENGGRMILGTDQGATLTVDGGATWSSWYNQPTAQFYHVVTDRAYPYRIYGAQQDAGSVAITSRSDYGVITVRDWFSPSAGEAGYVAPDPRDTTLVYGGDTYGVVHRFDRRTGQAQDISPTPAEPFGRPMPSRRFRFTWTSPLVFDPLDPSVLYLGSQVLLRTTDGGLHWTSASPDLTRARPAAASADTSGPPTVENAAERGYGVIYTIAPSPLRKGVLWAGTDDGKVQLTTDAGGHWTDVTPDGLTPWSKVSLIDAAPWDTGGAYAAVDRHRLDDFAPYVYRTHDYGRHWTRIDRGIPPGAFVRAVRADPVRRGLLYAGTERGVYVSFDDGDSWQSLQLNLPAVPVHDLVVHDSDLVIATHGRSFWVLDDLAPLRQLNDSVLRSAVHLFRPVTAVRVRRSVNLDTPLPPEVPHGENPPAGAVIDYSLRAVPRGPVLVEILDANGVVVRRASSDDRPAPPKQPPQFAASWLPRPAVPTTRVGLNRFVWDLRYPPPPASTYDYSIAAIPGQGTVTEPQGPLVVPGEYRVRLTAGGVTRTQPLRVAMDPRLHASDAALAAQLRLSLDIWAAMAEANALQQRVAGLQAALLSVDALRLDPSTGGALTALYIAAGAVGAGEIGDALGGLETVVGSADRAPTSQAAAAFAELRERLAAARARWAAIERTELPALNARLSRLGVPPVRAPVVQPATIR